MPLSHQPSDPPGALGVDISVVVPAYNGAHTIIECLRSVERATRGRRAEIIVVDSSTDPTAEIIRHHFPNAVLVRSDVRLSAGAARNLGAAAAHGRLIFFTDQDCIVPEDWIEQMEAHFADPTVHAVGGAVGIRNLSSASGCALYFLEFLNHFPRNGQPRRDGNFLVGCNSAFRAAVGHAAPFPDRTLGEDILFSKQLQERGLHLVYDPRIAVSHHNRDGWREFFRYNDRMGRASAQYHAELQLWWAAPVLRWPSLAFVAPLVVLPSIARDLLRSRRSYLLRFLALIPMCLLGNLTWANGFRQEAKGIAARATVRPLDDRHRSKDARPHASQP
jgi:cellulose synthase/poly-beta-1,6-N-acetylglucosamine synthase-like glycosyltransferase